MRKIDNETLELYLGFYLDQLGFSTTYSPMTYKAIPDVEFTLEYAMNDEDMMYEFGLIGEDEYAGIIVFDEGHALRFMNRELLKQLKLEETLHERSKPSAADIASVAAHRGEYLSANWPGLSC